MVIGGGKTRALRKQRRRQAANSSRQEKPAAKGSKLANWLRRLNPSRGQRDK